MDISLWRSFPLVTIKTTNTLDLVGVQVRWEGEGTEPAEYTFSSGQRNENNELGTGYFVHKKIISAVTTVEFVSDRMSHAILTVSWCHTIVLKCSRSKRG
jgi:hypothetical protein